MKSKEIINALEQKWPSTWALSWDNVGLLVGSEEKEVRRILVTLDVTDEVLDQAISKQADMIISHHPLIFSALKKVTNRNFTQRRIISLIRNDIAYYALHTNFDIKGMGQLHSKLLGLTKEQILWEPFEKAGEGMGRVGQIGSPQKLSDYAHFVKERLGITHVQVYGEKEKMIFRVAISGGSGKSMIESALDFAADVLVTGDIDHHTGIDAAAQGLALIDAGHYGTEWMFMDEIKQYLKGELSGVVVETAKTREPFWVV